MKKKMLLLVLGCLLPMSVHAICFRYVDGPKDMSRILVEVDSTKIGSNLPTQLRFTEDLFKDGLFKGEDSSYKTIARSLIETNTVYATIKWEKSGMAEAKTLVKGQKLDNKAAYDITIDSNRKVTFTKTNATCPKR